MKSVYLAFYLLHFINFYVLPLNAQDISTNEKTSIELINTSLSKDFSTNDFIRNRFPTYLSTEHYILQSIEISEVEPRTLPPFKKPIVSMGMSALIPGSAQIVHKKWVRAGFYAAVEILGLVQNRHHTNKAKRLERQYYDYIDQNWSVVKYANWLIGYNQYYETNQNLLDVWRDGAAQQASYSKFEDWAQVDLELLRQLERNTIYLTTLPGGTIQRDLAFSHVVPDYGSQQYYELASKYYQFAPGWRDFNVANNATDISRLRWDYDTISMLSPMWLDGSLQADRFNNHYRYASNWVSLLLINHIVSAFDGYFTAKLAGHRLSLEAPIAQNELFKFRLDL